MHVEHAVPLAPLTTLGIGGLAKQLVRPESATELAQVVVTSRLSGESLLILGGGSNVVINDGGFDGVVVQPAMREVAIKRAGERAVVTVGAGVVWDDFVAQMIDEGLSGIECLSGIPGLVGATPMQNVGAYGQEVSEVIDSVYVLDRASVALFQRYSNLKCGFGYRTSMFRGTDRWVVTEVTFTLRKTPESAPIKYAELSKALGIADGKTAPLKTVRDTVIALRRAKGMVVDPGDPESRSAGSFFTNPIIDDKSRAAFDARLAKVGSPRYPSWPAGEGKTKLAAAWLIERAGFRKGHTVGKVGISNKHALALVNRGGGTASELLALAQQIQDQVRDKLGVSLQLEPVII